MGKAKIMSGGGKTKISNGILVEAVSRDGTIPANTFVDYTTDVNVVPSGYTTISSGGTALAFCTDPKRNQVYMLYTENSKLYLNIYNISNDVVAFSKGNIPIPSRDSIPEVTPSKYYMSMYNDKLLLINDLRTTGHIEIDFFTITDDDVITLKRHDVTVSDLMKKSSASKLDVSNFKVQPIENMNCIVIYIYSSVGATYNRYFCGVLVSEDFNISILNPAQVTHSTCLSTCITKKNIVYAMQSSDDTKRYLYEIRVVDNASISAILLGQLGSSNYHTKIMSPGIQDFIVTAEEQSQYIYYESYAPKPADIIAALGTVHFNIAYGTTGVSGYNSIFAVNASKNATSKLILVKINYDGSMTITKVLDREDAAGIDNMARPKVLKLNNAVLSVNATRDEIVYWANLTDFASTSMIAIEGITANKITVDKPGKIWLLDTGADAGEVTAEAIAHTNSIKDAVIDEIRQEVTNVD